MYCPSCGSEVLDEAVFCGKCGHNVQEFAETTALPVASLAEEVPPTERLVKGNEPGNQCWQCGASVDDSMEFCGGCGADLTLSAIEAGTLPINELVPGPELFESAFEGAQKADTRPIKALIAIFGVAALALGLVTVFFLFRTRTTVITTYQTINYQTKRFRDPDLIEGLTYPKTVGKNGRRELRIKIWKDRRGKEVSRKVVASSIITKPVDEVIAEGSKLKKDVIIEIKELIKQYLEARKSGDYAKILSMSTPTSITGYDAAAISNSYAVTKDAITGYEVFEPTIDIANKNKLVGGGNQSASSGKRVELSKIAPAVADIPISIVLDSPMFGRRQIEEHVRAAWMNKAWKIDYFGQWNAIAPTLTKTTSGTDEYNDKEQWMHALTLKYVIMYPDKTLVIFEEKNVSPANNPYPVDDWSHDSWEPPDVDSEFGDTSDISLTDDSGKTYSYSLSEGKSTIRSEQMKSGQSQISEMVFTPGVHPGANSLTVKTKNYEFPGIKIP